MSVDKSDEESCLDDELCVLCKRDIRFSKDCYEMYDDEYYCSSLCMRVHVKEELNNKPLDEVEGMFWGDGDQLYEWIYGEGVDNAVEIISNWWFNQRKKMFRKPVKSAQKKM